MCAATTPGLRRRPDRNLPLLLSLLNLDPITVLDERAMTTEPETQKTGTHRDLSTFLDLTVTELTHENPQGV